MKEIQEMGKTAEAVQCDVSDFEQCSQLIQQVQEHYGRIDILVNNAGITRDGLAMAMKEEDFDDVIATNLKVLLTASGLHPES